MENFEVVWAKIVHHKGEQFFTKTNIPFTYRIEGNSVVPDRTDYPIAKSQFQKAMQLMPLPGPGVINNIVRGPAYVYAILTDDRMKN